MAKVDFYLLPVIERPACYPFVCRLADKAYQQKRSVYIYSLDQAEATLLDDLLWTFRDISFLPHCLESANNDAIKLPIRIGCTQPLAPPYGLLINLTTTIPDFFTQFARIIEFVLQETTAKDLARKKYSFYREATCKLATHNLSGAAV